MQNKIKNPLLYRSIVEGLEYIFEFKIVDDKIHIKIKENNEFVPYCYEGFFTHEDFIRHHKAFKSCKNVNEILPHLFNLYNAKKITIRDIGPNNIRYMYFTIYDISIEVTTELFELERKMVENKDKALIELYEKQKKLIKGMKEIEQLIIKGTNFDDNLRKDLLKMISGGNGK